MNEKIQINNYVFTLEKDKHENKIISCKFTHFGVEETDMSEIDLKFGHILQQEIFSGKWDWLIFTKGLIKISEFGIEITLSDPVYDGSLRWRGGHISTEMKELCPHCEDKLCDFDCPDAMEWASSQDFGDQVSNNEELDSNRYFNYGVDAIESMVLTHAIAGLNIESEMYVSGIRAALEGLANNM